MRTERTTGTRPGRVVRTGPAVPAVLVVLMVLAVPALTGCAATVAGTPWPARHGPALPADTAGALPQAAATPAGSATPAPRPVAPTQQRAGPVADPTAPPAGPDAPPSPSTGPAPPRTGADRPPGPVISTPGPAGPTTRTVPPTPVAAPRPRPGPGTPGRERAPAALTADVVADECLLDAGVLTGLLGAEPAVPATNTATERADGSRSRSCFAVGGSSTVSVNVYRTQRTSPARYVHDAADAADARALGGTGARTAAALLDTVAGPTLQLGTARHLVTIAVAGRSPTDGQWRAAARAAAAALARDR